jgi:DNA-binding GntR family transcriptional regulator
VAEIAKEAGVSADDARKVLHKLGVDGLLSNISKAGADVHKLNVGNLKLAARLNGSGIFV